MQEQVVGSSIEVCSRPELELCPSQTAATLTRGVEKLFLNFSEGLRFSFRDAGVREDQDQQEHGDVAPEDGGNPPEPNKDRNYLQGYGRQRRQPQRHNGHGETLHVRGEYLGADGRREAGNAAGVANLEDRRPDDGQPRGNRVQVEGNGAHSQRDCADGGGEHHEGTTTEAIHGGDGHA